MVEAYVGAPDTDAYRTQFLTDTYLPQPIGLWDGDAPDHVDCASPQHPNAYHTVESIGCVEYPYIAFCDAFFDADLWR